VGRYGFLLVPVVLLMGGCEGNNPNAITEDPVGDLVTREELPGYSGGLVLSVGGETITADEVIGAVMEDLRPIAERSGFARFKEQARPVVEQYFTAKVSDIILYRQARKKASSNINIDEALEKAAEAEVKRFVVGFGGDYAKAEEALEKMGHDWASFKEFQKRLILNQNYIVSQLPDNRGVTYRELVDYYNEIKDEFFVTPATVTFQVIDIEAAKLEVRDPNKGRSEEARKLAGELAGRIKAGEDFGELAKQYSHGHRAVFGGMWRPVDPNSLAEPYDILGAEAEKMEPGEIAGSIEAGEHIFIMKLIEKWAKSFEPFEKVQKIVGEKFLFERRKKAWDELEAKFAEQAKVGNKEEFIDFCGQKIYDMSRK